ncbi:hypothetical protein [Aliidiomarina sp.]|uniref:hypothetical protein n=1 Tax=Aliidiomarina sp. TaxID=1872439 RepID=UPI003A4E2728
MQPYVQQELQQKLPQKVQQHSVGGARVLRGALAAAVVIAISGCSAEQAAPTEAPHVAFFNALHSLCGNAYAGERIVERPGQDLLEGDEALTVHFRECSETEIKAPFHIEQPATNTWDRSRTWIYSLAGDHLTINHDHREPDGSHSEHTFYGGATVDSGTAEQQMFIYTERTGDAGEVLGWRIEVVPGKRYSYGTMADGEWTWRIDFDLTTTIALPPAPWGFE